MAEVRSVGAVSLLVICQPSPERASRTSASPSWTRRSAAAWSATWVTLTSSESSPADMVRPTASASVRPSAEATATVVALVRLAIQPWNPVIPISRTMVMTVPMMKFLSRSLTAISRAATSCQALRGARPPPGAAAP